MPTWLEVLFNVFAAMGALCALYTTIYKIRRCFLDKVSEKHFLIDYEAKAPAVKKDHIKPVVETKITFYNKTSRNLIVTKLELIDGINAFPIKGAEEPYVFTVLANTKVAEKYKFEIKPPQYLLPQECTLKIYVGDKILTYIVETNSKELPY